MVQRREWEKKEQRQKNGGGGEAITDDPKTEDWKPEVETDTNWNDHITIASVFPGMDSVLLSVASFFILVTLQVQGLIDASDKIENLQTQTFHSTCCLQSCGTKSWVENLGSRLQKRP